MVLELFSEHVHRRGIHRTRQVLVLDEVREPAVSPLPTGLSSDIGSCDADNPPDLRHRAAQATFMLPGRLRPGITDRLDILGIEDIHLQCELIQRASRPSVCIICRWMRISRLIVSTMCTGMRIVRAWSAMARLMAWRIHQVP